MGLVVPAGYISTSDAFEKMVGADTECCRLRASWEKDGQPIEGPAFDKLEKRQKTLWSALYDAVAADEIPLFAYGLNDAGKQYLGELTGAYRRDPRAAAELLTGKIDRRKMSRQERAAIPALTTPCFRRANLNAWLAAYFKTEGASEPEEVRKPEEAGEVETHAVEEVDPRRRARPPAPAEQPVEAPKATPEKPDLDCMREWYRLERVAKHDAKKPPPSREDDQKAAREYFEMGGLNPLVRKARAAEAPWNWKQGGSRGRKATELRARQKAQRDQLTR